MRWLWHRLLVLLGRRQDRPNVLTAEMVARVGLQSLGNNQVWRRFDEKRKP